MVSESLEEYYRLNALLQFEYGIPINVLEDMMPFESGLYTDLLIEREEKKKQK